MCECVNVALLIAYDSAMHARQLVHMNEWTTMSTISVEFHGVPYSNIVSYSGAFDKRLCLCRCIRGQLSRSIVDPRSRNRLKQNEQSRLTTRARVCVIAPAADGIGESPEASTGELFFYLTPMDATGACVRVCVLVCCS